MIPREKSDSFKETCMLAALREATWIGRGRVQGYSIILLVLTGICSAFVVYTRVNPTGGTPVGGDFISFQAAATLAADGKAYSAYNPKVQHDTERKLAGRADVDYFSFFYPPVFILICLPFALLPHQTAFILWLAATGGVYWKMLRMYLAERGTIIPVLAFPAVFVNASFGQNGFLSGALLGFGALLLSKRPILSGLCYGTLIYKPHLGLLIPITLAAARAWRTLISAGAMALGLIVLSWAVFGPETWAAFFDSNHRARDAMENNLIGYEKFQSVFAFARTVGVGIVPAYFAQAFVGIAVAGALVWAAWRVPAGPALGAALAAGTLLVSPFLLVYDLAILGVPVAWLAAEGVSSGFKPWEKIVLLSVYLLPGIALANQFAGVPIPWCPLITSLLLLLVLRRMYQGLGASSSRTNPVAQTDALSAA
jgi:hypothetical protein